MTKRKDVCVWCLSIVTVPNDYNPEKDKLVCDWSCWWAEKLFCMHFSDSEITMRSYYEDDG